jgi:excisionase family DNA binding protein
MSNDRSYTVEEFAEAERISRGMVYRLWDQGKGPEYYMVGNRRRITEAARQEWHRRQEAGSGQ